MDAGGKPTPVAFGHRTMSVAPRWLPGKPLFVRELPVPEASLPVGNGRCIEASPGRKSISLAIAAYCLLVVSHRCVFDAESMLECGERLAARTRSAMGQGTCCRPIAFVAVQWELAVLWLWKSRWLVPTCSRPVFAMLVQTSRWRLWLDRAGAGLPSISCPRSGNIGHLAVWPVLARTCPGHVAHAAGGLICAEGNFRHVVGCMSDRVLSYGHGVAGLAGARAPSVLLTTL